MPAMKLKPSVPSGGVLVGCGADTGLAYAAIHSRARIRGGSVRFCPEETQSALTDGLRFARAAAVVRPADKRRLSLEGPALTNYKRGHVRGS